MGFGFSISRSKKKILTTGMFKPSGKRITLDAVHKLSHLKIDDF